MARLPVRVLLPGIALAASLVVGCAKSGGETAAPAPSVPAPAAQAAAVPSSIDIDGSSTVFPITEAVAEAFRAKNPARLVIGVSGTGGGFKKFCADEIAVADASRPIKPVEAEACAKAGIEYVELPVAYDGIAVVVNPKNTWATSMTVAELKKLWEPEAQGKVTKWSHIRKGWPDRPVHLFGAGPDSGTYDYFTQAIVGTEHASRGDYTPSEDDNVLVQGISSDELALGFFGFAYYNDNQAKLKIVPIDDGNDANGKGPIVPTLETVANGTYQPLSRPIFIYVSAKAAGRPEVAAFVNFYLGAEGRKMPADVGYIPLPDATYDLVLGRFTRRETGSVFGGHGSQVGVRLDDLLSREQGK